MSDSQRDAAAVRQLLIGIGEAGGVAVSGHSHCQECGDKLGHRAVFCPYCGRSCCSWECQDRHAAHHAEKSRPPQHLTLSESSAVGVVRSR